MRLFDEAVAWMVSRGQAGQWGDTPPSQTPDWRARIHEAATRSELHVLSLEHREVGVLALNDAPGHLPPAEVSEVYIELLLTARSHQGQHLGTALLDIAERIARERSARRLRVDCWAEAPTLIGWYEREGFQPAGVFALRGWRGQVFTRPVPYER